MLKQLLLALKRLLRALGPVLVGCIFLGAVYLLYREISKYSLADIRMSLAQISTGSIILSVLLAIINYIILIDLLVLRGILHRRNAGHGVRERRTVVSGKGQLP